MRRIVFPATAYAGISAYYTNDAAWSCLARHGPVSSEWIVPVTICGPIRRATFRQPSTGWQMDETMAEHYFRGNDDLTVDFPPRDNLDFRSRDDRPSMQTWDTTTTTTAGTTPLARKWTGDYSWIVTVVPTTNAARDGMATIPKDLLTMFR